jgi:hypothetical protein
MMQTAPDRNSQTPAEHSTAGCIEHQQGLAHGFLIAFGEAYWRSWVSKGFREESGVPVKR